MRLPFFIILLATVCPCIHAATSIPGNDPRIAIEGRTEWDGQGLQMGFPAVILRFAYSGPAPVIRLNASSEECYFNLSCNGWDPVVIQLKKGLNEVPLVSGPAPAKGWTIELARRTESYMGTVSFEGLTLPEGCTLLAPPALPERKLLVIGDSTAAGEFIDSVPPVYVSKTRGTNATRNFGMLLGRWVNAQTQMIAYGGQGLMYDWSGKPSNQLLTLIYSRALPDKLDSTWDPQRFPADAVVVNTGTDTDNASPSDEVLAGAFEKFVAQIRKDYPKAAIILCQNSHHHEDAPQRAQLLRVLEAVVAKSHSAGDARVHLARCKFYPGSPNDAHIVAFQQEQIAEEILPVLKQATGW